METWQNLGDRAELASFLASSSPYGFFWKLLEKYTNITIYDGHLKELMLQDEVITRTDTVASLHAACTLVDTTMLQLVQSSIPRCSQAYLDIHGGRFEHLFY
ncbi:hypothetical protein TNCV_1576761 [Trichonephila clavipes]|nr:hypothetical protein TNCV_1576761 [Trichonephila clavipes]